MLLVYKCRIESPLAAAKVVLCSTDAAVRRKHQTQLRHWSACDIWSDDSMCNF